MNYELYALDFGGGKGKLGIMKDLSPALTTTHAGAPVVNQMMWDGTQVCPTLSCRNAGGSQRMPDKNHFNAVIEQKNGGVEMIVRRLTPKECERLQGYSDGWTEGESDTQRYKQCGNSVAVPCVEFLMQGISEVLKSYDDD